MNNREVVDLFKTCDVGMWFYFDVDMNRSSLLSRVNGMCAQYTCKAKIKNTTKPDERKITEDFGGKSILPTPLGK